jgi:hypothetical protein
MLLFNWAEMGSRDVLGWGQKHYLRIHNRNITIRRRPALGIGKIALSVVYAEAA